METEFQFGFSPEVEREREALRAFILTALAENTLSAIRAAQEQLCAWLREHPEDYVLRDAGEPLALTEDALQAQKEAVVS
jgi:hypothetical protein